MPPHPGRRQRRRIVKRPEGSERSVASRAKRRNESYEVAGAGWLTFAGIMLTLAGFFNVINGIAAISDSKYLVKQLLFSNLHAWGWFFLIWGIIMICAGIAIFSGAQWAATIGIIAAFFNVIAQLSWVRVNPVWAVSAMVIDVLVIYGLVVYGGRGKEV
jgi:hypothetical protein